MLADQFLEAAAAVKNTHAVDEVPRLLWRANAEGRPWAARERRRQEQDGLPLLHADWLALELGEDIAR